MFFFFKQKTAYEMRISDWSSDVCSSDLRQGQAYDQLIAKARQYTNETRFQREGRLRREAGRLGVPEGVSTGGGGRASRSSHPPRRQQTGRASCRERVCQDV